MLHFLIYDEDVNPSDLFAECELDLMGLTPDSTPTWVWGPVNKDGRLGFGETKWKATKERSFSFELKGDELADFNDCCQFDLLVGGNDADTKITAKPPSDASTSADGLVWQFFKGNRKKRKTVFNELLRGLMFDSVFVLQWTSKSNGVRSVKLPISIAAAKEDIDRYNDMRKELETHGLFSFVFDALNGLFSKNRVDLAWNYGGSVFSDSEPEIEKRAIAQIWKRMFLVWIPNLLKNPIWKTSEHLGIVPSCKVRRIYPTIFRSLRSNGVSPYVCSTERTVSYVVGPHVMLYSFLNRICRRYRYLAEVTFEQCQRRFRRDLDDETKGESGISHDGVIVEIQQKLLDVDDKYKREISLSNTMLNDLRRLSKTDVFKDVPLQSQLSYHDVPIAEFSMSRVYECIYSAIEAFHKSFFNWRLPRTSSVSRRAIPITEGTQQGDSFACWKYSKMYQYWVYFQLCTAAVRCKLKLVDKCFHSDDGSWVLFESTDGIQFKLFHEVKGAARGILEKKSAESPLGSDCWCASDWKQNNEYMTPDFVCVVSLKNGPSFLIVLDAKTKSVWDKKEHEKAQNKYAGFRLLKEGYSGSKRTPEIAVCAHQSWIVYPKEGAAIEVDPSGPWTYEGNVLFKDFGANPDVNPEDVCRGQLQGCCKFGGDVPFRMFFEAQLAYCRALADEESTH